MTPEERNAQLAKPLNAIVAVSRRAGGPQLTPVWFYWDGEAFFFSTTRSREKYKNIKRNPEISLIVDDLAAHTYVAAYGRAEIVEGDRTEALQNGLRYRRRRDPDGDVLQLVARFPVVGDVILQRLGGHLGSASLRRALQALSA